MYSSAVLVSVLAATVSANMQPVGIPLPKRAIEARQTDSTDAPTGTADAACTSAVDTIYSLIAGIPTPPADIESFEATQTATDPCSLVLPSSLTSDYNSWTSQVLSWYSASAETLVSSAISQCPSLTDSGDSTDLGVCTSEGAVASGSSGTSTGGAASVSATTTSSGGSSASGSSSAASSAATSKASQAAGASSREVGVMGAVFAGVLGAVAAL